MGRAPGRSSLKRIIHYVGIFSSVLRRLGHCARKRDNFPLSRMREIAVGTVHDGTGGRVILLGGHLLVVLGHDGLDEDARGKKQGVEPYWQMAHLSITEVQAGLLSTRASCRPVL